MSFPFVGLVVFLIGGMQSPPATRPHSCVPMTALATTLVYLFCATSPSACQGEDWMADSPLLVHCVVRQHLKVPGTEGVHGTQ